MDFSCTDHFVLQRWYSGLLNELMLSWAWACLLSCWKMPQGLCYRHKSLCSFQQTQPPVEQLLLPKQHEQINVLYLFWSAQHFLYTLQVGWKLQKTMTQWKFPCNESMSLNTSRHVAAEQSCDLFFHPTP